MPNVGRGASNGGDSSSDTTETPPDKAAHDEPNFECNICLDTAKDAVVSFCGHLFCWPCLHQWLETRPIRQMCPVCKAGISKDKVIPLYGRGNVNQVDPREKLPPRPVGQRTDPENNGSFSNFNFADGGFHMSFGIGAFPFGFISSTFNLGDRRADRSGRQGMDQHSTDAVEDEVLSKIFLWVAILFVFWLLLA